MNGVANGSDPSSLGDSMGIEQYSAREVGGGWTMFMGFAEVTFNKLSEAISVLDMSFKRN
tara:strand:+ start:889 stop:1068 length:180 start_codon:yes stop_codon:yes gene_type:complete